MATALASSGTPPSRVAMLGSLPGFDAFPAEALQDLAFRLFEEHHSAGSVIVGEGELGNCLYIITEGRAEVSASTPAGPVPLATLGPGELFGELSLVTASGQRQATVTALTPLRVLGLSGPVFKRLLETHPQAQAAFDASAESMLVAKFLKQAAPFAALDGPRLKSVAERLKRVAVSPGDTIIRQGDPGQTCYLVRSGRVEVLGSGDGVPERRLATLGAGAVFGEAALLTDSPRNATVRALEATELLELSRVEIMEVVGPDRRAGVRMLEWQHLRGRPCQVENIVIQQRQTPEGETITILKDPYRGVYFRLSPEGWFLWQRLDGQRTLRDLSMEYLAEFKIFAPQAIAQMLGGLEQVGFVEGTATRTSEFQAVSQPRSPFGRPLVQRLMEWRVALPNANPAFALLYRAGLRALFTRPGQLLAALLGLAGAVAFVLGAEPAVAGLLQAQAGLAWLLVLVPAYLVAVVARELGYALATTAFGREVRSVAIGWHWLKPILFADTSEMWQAERWPRIATALAGPFANLVLGGLAAVVAWFAVDTLAVAAWLIALANYLALLLNLSPLSESAGSHVLAEVLNRPSLRVRAFGWLSNELPQALQAPRLLVGRSVELLFGLWVVVYVALGVLLAATLYQLLVHDRLAEVVPGVVAAGLGWVIVAAVLAAAGWAAFVELQSTRLPEGDEDWPPG